MNRRNFMFCLSLAPFIELPNIVSRKKIELKAFTTSNEFGEITKIHWKRKKQKRYCIVWNTQPNNFIPKDVYDELSRFGIHNCEITVHKYIPDGNCFYNEIDY